MRYTHDLKIFRARNKLSQARAAPWFGFQSHQSYSDFERSGKGSNAYRSHLVSLIRSSPSAVVALGSAPNPVALGIALDKAQR